MIQYKKYLKIINYIDEHTEEIIDENQSSVVEKIVSLEEKFVRCNVDFIVMTECQIDELMSYIKESIEKYGVVSTNYYNETFYIRSVLERFVSKIKEDNSKESSAKLEKVETFLAFVRASENVGFCELLEGHISYTDNKFYISTHNSKLVCKINEDGINEVTSNELEDEDLLLADKMYLGNLTGNESMNCIFLEKIVNGQRRVKAISYNQEIYDVYGFDESQIENSNKSEKAFLYDKLNDYFEKMEFPFLCSNIFTKDSLFETIGAFNKLCKMSLEERKEIENIIDIATSWWVNNSSSYCFDDAIEGQIGENLNLLEEMFPNDADVLNKKQIKKFKETLGNKIRVILLSRHICGLHVEYCPEGELADAIKESKINSHFPIKTRMTITRDKIEVQKGYGSPVEVIYSKDIGTNQHFLKFSIKL